MEVTIMHSPPDMQPSPFKELLFYNADMVGNSEFRLISSPLMLLGDGLIAINMIGGIFFVVLQ